VARRRWRAETHAYSGEQTLLLLSRGMGVQAAFVPPTIMPKNIEPTSLGMWTVECGETSRRFAGKAEVFAGVSELARTQASGRIDADEDVGGRSWISRFVFGLHPRILQMHFAMEWSGAVASLIFFDDAASEYRAKDKKQPVHADEATRKAIAHGEPSPHPTEQCLTLDRALQAIDEYLRNGTRPDWLEYDYVA